MTIERGSAIKSLMMKSLIQPQRGAAAGPVRVAPKPAGPRRVGFRQFSGDLEQTGCAIFERRGT